MRSSKDFETYTSLSIFDEKAYRASHTASRDAGSVIWKGFTRLEKYEGTGPGSGGKRYD